MRVLYTFLLKDILLVRRDKKGMISVFFFTALVSLLLFFGLGYQNIPEEVIVPSVVWLSTFFGGTLQLNRTFDHEREESVMEGLRLVPNAVSLVYLSKFLINTVMIFLVSLFAAFFAGLLFNYFQDFSFMLPIALGAVGMSVLGTALSSMVMGHHKKDIILPALLYPLMVPVVISVIKATEAGAGDNIPWLRIIIIFNVVYLAVSYMLFESIMDE